MPGRKTIFLLKGQREMGRVGIADLRRHHLYRDLAVEQLPGMLQLVLLIITEQGLAVISFEFCLQAGGAHGRDAGQLFDAGELLLVMRAQMLLHPGQAAGVLGAKAIPFGGKLLHDEELLEEILHEHRYVSDGEQLAEGVLDDLGHEIVQQEAVFEGDGPAQGGRAFGRIENGADGAGVEILDQVVEAAFADADDEAADDPLTGIDDRLTPARIGDRNRGMAFLGAAHVIDRQIGIPLSRNFYLIEMQDIGGSIGGRLEADGQIIREHGNIESQHLDAGIDAGGR